MHDISSFLTLLLFVILLVLSLLFCVIVRVTFSITKSILNLGIIGIHPRERAKQLQ
jgi:hypothetical protein